MKTSLLTYATEVLMGKQQINRIARFSDEEIVELYWHRDENAIRITNDIYGVLLYAHNDR